MMDLINTGEIAKDINIKRVRINPTSKLFIQLLGIKKFNKFYIENYNKCCNDFINSFIEQFNIKFEVLNEDLNKIPQAGSFITISNHPFAGIDGMLLLKIISEKRPDFKLIADQLLQKISPLHDKIFPFNPFRKSKSQTSNFSAYKFLISYLAGR